MDVKASIDLVCARLLDSTSIPVKIRSRNKVSQSEVDELFAAIDFLIDYYRGEELIPRKLALAFVDVYVGFSIKDGFFDDIESQRYEDIGISLQEKAYELFG
ncbi:hypothetical protein [Pseudomonas viridiflava]|uniref:hypothetical protein n=1 Tax=Pseudomonas viridiflava TaxID=33069 RepID=UPI0018E5E636|nr:hypothetical protein [Pseudomonas viridiflava]MBI6703384.1 hypothetical protein [Pseudomonas viridiflava]